MIRYYITKHERLYRGAYAILGDPWPTTIKDTEAMLLKAIREIFEDMSSEEYMELFKERLIHEHDLDVHYSNDHN